MKPLFIDLCALALLSLIPSITPLQAQTAAIETRPAAPYYDAAREVTLKGTATSVLTNPSPGMVMGSHLFLATASGEVDASLGRFGLLGKGAPSVAAGQQVEVTGVMKTLLNKQVFVARTVKVGGEVFTMRNQHGIQVSPQARERARQMTTQKLDSL
jgi:hypothetical protein